MVWHNPPAPKPPEQIDLAKPAFLGSGPDPKGCGVQVTHPKIICKEICGFWKFRANPFYGLKVTALFWSDRRTGTQAPRRTDKNKSSQYHCGILRQNDVWWSPSSLVLCMTTKFYLANQESGPFCEDFDGPVEARRCVKSKSWTKQNVPRIWFCDFIKNTRRVLGVR